MIMDLYTFSIYDNDVHDIIYTDIFTSREQCIVKLKEILYTIDGEISKQQLETQILLFKQTEFIKNSYSFWFPKGNRLIHIDLV